MAVIGDVFPFLAYPVLMIGLLVVGSVAQNRSAARKATSEARIMALQGYSGGAHGWTKVVDGEVIHVQTVPLGYTSNRSGPCVMVGVAVKGSVYVGRGVRPARPFESTVAAPYIQVAGLREVNGSTLAELLLTRSGVLDTLGDTPFILTEGRASFLLQGTPEGVDLEGAIARLLAFKQAVGPLLEDPIRHALPLLDQGEPSQRAQLLEALILPLSGRGELSAVAARYIQDPAPEVRFAAALAQAHLGEDRSAFFVAAAQNPDAQLTLIQDLERVEGTRTLRPLLAHLRKSPHAAVELAAIEQSAACDDRSAGPDLLAAVRDGTDTLATAALSALATLHLSELEPAAIAALQRPHLADRAVELLGEHGSVAAVAPLLAYAGQPLVVGARDVAVRMAITRIQSRLGPVDAGRVSVTTEGGAVSIAPAAGRVSVKQ